MTTWRDRAGCLSLPAALYFPYCDELELPGYRAAGVIARRLLVRRSLARRVAIELVPDPSFDPAPEEILRSAQYLRRVRRTVLGFLDRPASAVRIRLSSSAGQMSYRLEGPARA